jgi:hypothetical protein
MKARCGCGWRWAHGSIIIVLRVLNTRCTVIYETWLQTKEIVRQDLRCKGVRWHLPGTRFMYGGLESGYRGRFSVSATRHVTHHTSNRRLGVEFRFQMTRRLRGFPREPPEPRHTSTSDPRRRDKLGSYCKRHDAWIRRRRSKHPSRLQLCNALFLRIDFLRFLVDLRYPPTRREERIISFLCKALLYGMLYVRQMHKSSVSRSCCHRIS